jgi:hypothetical protein
MASQKNNTRRPQSTIKKCLAMISMENTNYAWDILKRGRTKNKFVTFQGTISSSLQDVSLSF